MKCNFCNGNMEFIYKLDNYNIVQCNNCYTYKVYNMPTDEELKRYYSGFTFQCNENIKNILTKNYFYDWYKSFNLPENAKMLDICGGGFSYAFEYFNIGKSTYLDLDDKACEFAKNIMGIKNILNMDISNINIKDKYNFIYCRHVIEHLKEPEKLINYACRLISKNGVFILHFPNGLSLERFGYKDLINRKLKRLMKSNNFSYIKAYKYLLSNKFCHGLDPINHLWSITSKAISIYLDQLGYKYKIKYSLLDDKIYSPYFNYSSNKEKMKAKLINMSLTKIYGGTHLIFIIKGRYVKDTSYFIRIYNIKNYNLRCKFISQRRLFVA